MICACIIIPERLSRSKIKVFNVTNYIACNYIANVSIIWLKSHTVMHVDVWLMEISLATINYFVHCIDNNCTQKDICVKWVASYWIRRCRVTHICDCKIDHYWFSWLVACTVPGHYLNQYWLIVNAILGQNVEKKKNVFILTNELENVVSNMADILSRPNMLTPWLIDQDGHKLADNNCKNIFSWTVSNLTEVLLNINLWVPLMISYNYTR